MSAMAVRTRLRGAQFGDDYAMGKAMQRMEEGKCPISNPQPPTLNVQRSTLNGRGSVSQLSTLNSQLSSLRRRSGRDLRGSAEGKCGGAGRDQIRWLCDRWSKRWRTGRGDDAR